MSKIINTKIYQKLKNTAIELDGKLTFSYQQVNGGMATGGLYNFVITKDWNGLELLITTSLDELPLQKDEYESCQIRITAYKDSPSAIELSLWRKDYFDKFFGFNTVKTGYEEFDKVIALKPSKNIERFIRKIFENPDLRNKILKDKYRTYNIRSEEGRIIIQRKSALTMKNEEMIIDEYNRFDLFLTGLKEAHII